jgi:hypothetical protein
MIALLLYLPSFLPISYFLYYTCKSMLIIEYWVNISINQPITTLKLVNYHHFVSFFTIFRFKYLI